MKKPQSSPIFDDSDFPISIANSLTEINPGHMHLGSIAQRVKEGAHAAGGAVLE